ncbi:hypothetical protein C2S52_004860 [Perilla frutescens var. hirtella]|uniref:Uncharacterized protein n=1 Tax=Perilla frutescens var. hirtella TaxID=608512 RepID=A0AAD4J8H1_PERFH|nr:hypothetical protein C2S52_004860 [Perilla frutescens var. hirtella]KAH6828786.1 hypothetical protein C2S53_012923 [Perilla frutescens var. hirtella]
MAAEAPVAVGKTPHAIRVAPPRYGPGRLSAPFTSSDGTNKIDRHSPTKMQSKDYRDRQENEGCE